MVLASHLSREREPVCPPSWDEICAKFLVSKIEATLKTSAVRLCGCWIGCSGGRPQRNSKL